MCEGENRPGYVTANLSSYRIVKAYRDELKKAPTRAESVIWEFLRRKQTGHHIRRQHVIDIYIADFVCLRKKLVIEIDGEIHNNEEQIDSDLVRTSELNLKGFEVVRFTNEEVFQCPQSVADKIKVILDSIS